MKKAVAFPGSLSFSLRCMGTCPLPNFTKGKQLMLLPIQLASTLKRKNSQNGKLFPLSLVFLFQHAILPNNIDK